ncbi:MAG TPA: hypothetical protein DF699_07890 [Phycisphaerales bacterium]|nr:hypothetical protein [Phycisphaerales bacterium]
MAILLQSQVYSKAILNGISAKRSQPSQYSTISLSMGINLVICVAILNCVRRLELCAMTSLHHSGNGWLHAPGSREIKSKTS